MYDMIYASVNPWCTISSTQQMLVFFLCRRDFHAEKNRLGIPRLRRETLEMGKVLQMLRNQSVMLAEDFSKKPFLPFPTIVMENGPVLEETIVFERPILQFHEEYFSFPGIIFQGCYGSLFLKVFCCFIKKKEFHYPEESHCGKEGVGE